MDFQTQEIYYDMIVERYDQYRARHSQDDSLNEAFAAIPHQSSDLDATVSSKTVSIEASGFGKATLPARELSIIMMAMRKVREAIVASSRADAFALKAYLFIIRATILARHMESYHPALLHLFCKIHPSSPLSRLEYHEFVGYHILDLACRQNDLAQAYDVRNRTGYRDARVETIIHSIVHDNWYKFWNAHRSADKYQKHLMDWHGGSVRKHVIKCLGRSYLVVDKSYVETAAASSWEHLQKETNLGWELNGEAVTIRRMKMK